MDLDNSAAHESPDTQAFAEGAPPYYVVMTSEELGTEAWPCQDLEEALGTLARAARSAERSRQQDGVQRYFCIARDLPGEGVAWVPAPAAPTEPDEAFLLALFLSEAQGEEAPAPLPSCGGTLREAAA